MKQFLLLSILLIGYTPKAQVIIDITYNGEQMNYESVEQSIPTNSAIKLHYKNFPIQSKSNEAHFWLTVMPFKETYDQSDFLNKTNSIKSTGYIHKNGALSVTIKNEGKYVALLVKGAKSDRSKRWWQLGTFTAKQALAIEDNFQSQKTINLYPNPSDGVFTITPNDTISEILVQDQYGRSILKTSSGIFDLTNYPSGIYYATIYSTDGIQVKRKIIKK